MAVFKVVVDLSNDAFKDGREGSELVRILRKLADKCEAVDMAVNSGLTDLNGNVVGVAGYEDVDCTNCTISIKWSTGDVKEVRPDLTDGEAWEVLQRVEHDHDASNGVTWDTLLYTANDMFPRKTEEES